MIDSIWSTKIDTTNIPNRADSIEMMIEWILDGKNPSDSDPRFDSLTSSRQICQRRRSMTKWPMLRHTDWSILVNQKTTWRNRFESRFFYQCRTEREGNIFDWIHPHNYWSLRESRQLLMLANWKRSFLHGQWWSNLEGKQASILLIEVVIRLTVWHIVCRF